MRKGFGTKEAPLGYHRRVIQIRAVDSPNVQYALAEIRFGKEPSNTVIIPGVKSWGEYQKNLKMWNPRQQMEKLNAEWWEGADEMMFPSEWLDRAERRAIEVATKTGMRQAKGIGVDPAEGGDNTAIAVVDELGLLDLIYDKTPDTNQIRLSVMKMMAKYNVDPERVCFDRGGGGKQIADMMRGDGFNVKTVSFGEPLGLPPKEYGGKTSGKEKLDDKEQRYTYKNRRAQIFMAIRDLIKPIDGDALTSKDPTWAIPARFYELRQELEPIPLTTDGEDVVYLLPKYSKKTDGKKDGPSLTELIGHSPDMADAVAIAVYVMQSMDDEGDFVAGRWSY